MKIRTKLMLFFSVIYIIIILIFSGFFYRTIMLSIESGFLDQAGQILNAVKINFGLTKLSSVDEIKKLFQNFPKPKRLKQNPSDFFWLSIYDANRDLVGSSNLAELYPIAGQEIDFSQNSFRFIMPGVDNTIYFSSDEEKKAFLLGKIERFDAEQGTFYLVAVISITNELKNISKMRGSSLRIFFLFLIIIIIVGLLFIQYTLRPIKKVTRSLHKISKEDLSERLKADNERDEIGELTHSINQLFARLEDSFRREKQFISDISHEFKTPLAELRLSLENILNSPHLNEDELAILGSSLETLYNMDFLVQKLLDLSRLEQERAPFHPHPVDVCQIMKDVYDNLLYIAGSKELEFKIHFEQEPLMCRGDDKLLYIVFFNIVENAIKYTEKGSVLVLAARENNQIKVQIEDTGIGIPADKVKHIFEKFYRADTARTAQKGYGIGLSIVKRIIVLHRAEIRVQSIPGIKTRFTLYLPGESKD